MEAIKMTKEEYLKKNSDDMYEKVFVSKSNKK